MLKVTAVRCMASDSACCQELSVLSKFLCYLLITQTDTLL